MKRLLLAFTLTAPLAVPANAVNFSRVDLKPLLNIRVNSRVTDPRLSPLVSDASYFITRGGATTLYTADTVTAPGFAHSNQLVRAVGTAKEIAALREQIATNQIGQQSDCLASGAGLHGPQSWDVLWYGYGQVPRRRSFSVYFGTGPDGLPPCSAQVLQIVDAVRAYLEQATDNPGTEFLQSH